MRKETQVEIVVLLKQVPSTESLIEIDADGLSIKTADIKWVISPYDEFAVEEALRIRETHGGKVTILTVGPDKAAEAIRTALAMGADEGILINDPAALGCDALGVARVLAAALKQMPYDLIIAGQRAVDDDNYLVGTAVAEFLEIPNVSIVNKQDIGDGKISCRRTIEGGLVVIEAPLPALFTTQRGLNEPRYASLPGIMKAKKKPLATKTLADIGLEAASLGQPKVKIVALQPPSQRKGGRLVEGETAAEKAAELLRLLAEEAKVI
jgi:electron transfer flavoprotein beta subunit